MVLFARKLPDSLRGISESSTQASESYESMKERITCSQATILCFTIPNLLAHVLRGKKRANGASEVASDIFPTSWEQAGDWPGLLSRCVAEQVQLLPRILEPHVRRGFRSI